MVTKISKFKGFDDHNRLRVERHNDMGISRVLGVADNNGGDMIGEGEGEIGLGEGVKGVKEEARV